MKIYITHCSAKKENSLRNSNKKVSLDELYTATPTKRFMITCKNKNVEWAIFSDKYGICFPYEKYEWYEKDPNTVTHEEFNDLVKNFESRLNKYDEIFFYHNPGRFHQLYRELLEIVKVKDKIKLITHLYEIN